MFFIIAMWLWYKTVWKCSLHSMLNSFPSNRYANQLGYMNAFMYLLSTSHVSDMGLCSTDEVMNSPGTVPDLTELTAGAQGADSHACASCLERHFFLLLEKVTFTLDLNDKEETMVEDLREHFRQSEYQCKRLETRTRLHWKHCEWGGEWRERRWTERPEAGTMQNFAGHGKRSGL